jgi:hypothetical protein
MVAARRAAARIVDTLATADRFAVLTFDSVIDRPDGLPEGLVEANDRNRYRAVEHLARVNARGGTELLAPLRNALVLLRNNAGRDAVLVLVTDGQVGNEDQLLRELGDDLAHVRVHAVGIDQAVNAGFLGRLAAAGGGRCELVESEDRLDEAMEAIRRRIGAPLAHGLRLHADGLATVDDTASPARLPDLFPGVPLVVAGRYRGGASGSIVLRAKTGEEADWSVSVSGQRREAPAVTAQWARAHLRDLEDRYATAPGRARGSDELEKRIVATSLRFGVLCRFTAYVAVDSRVTAGGDVQHQVIQPVEAPAGWDMGQFATTGLRRAPEGVEIAPEPVARLNFDLASAPPLLGYAAPVTPRSRRPSRSRLERASLDGNGPAEPDTRSAPREDHTVATARDLARHQARRLRHAGPLTDEERRKLLADLADVLSALVVQLTTEGMPRTAFSALRELAARLKAGSAVGTMWDEQLWEEALRVLDDFAAGGDSRGKKRRALFWKRT